MRIYLVGGAVRDLLLVDQYQRNGERTQDQLNKLFPTDFDFVVIGATEQDMLDQGYQKVGNFFPVFLHPSDKSEYALARKEKKISSINPHTAFNFETKDVSLEEDLLRRDLTINAIAIEKTKIDIASLKKNNQNYKILPFKQDQIIDPYGGINDLKQKTLRHISPAFTEDPLRVFRVARFAARFPDFTIANHTLKLMSEVVATDEFNKLTVERVTQEMLLAFTYDRPSLFFETIKKVDGLAHFFPELEGHNQTWQQKMLAFDSAASIQSEYKVEILFSLLVYDFKSIISIEQFCEKLKIPNSLKNASIMVAKNIHKIENLNAATSSAIVQMFTEISAFKKPEMVEILAKTFEAYSQGRKKKNAKESLLLQEYFLQIKNITSKDIPPGLTGIAIGEEIQATKIKRLKALRDH